jgi:acetyl-CoA carboxylase carboxyl transferase subunit beta
MSILTWIEEKKRLKLLNAPKYIDPASDQPDLLSDGAPRGGRSSKGLWTRCDKCGVILYIKHLKENQRVCFGCTYHLQMSSQERIENLLDKESWRPFDETVSPCDPLEFHDQRNYTDRLRDAQDKTGLQDAIQTGTGLVDGIPVALGIMDFDFMGGSMGSVVGEKITRLIEYATQEGLTLLLVCASGGARMQEGVFSLMQMAKISSALQIYQSCANLLYISILTSPTTGGVTASFAMLGDIIFAEPKALIAFAGRRVIEQTLCEDLPEDFQTSEYMLHHGLVDLIVPRRFLRQALSESIRLYKNAPFKKPGRIPFGVQNPISFLTEEKLRRQCQAELDLGLIRPGRLNKSLGFVQPMSAAGAVKSGLANSSDALTDQRSVKQEAGTTLRFEVAKRLTGTTLRHAKRPNTLSRQSVEYREILTSFQMMYQLFSKQMSNGVLGLSKATYPTREGPWTKDKTLMGVVPVEEQNISELAETTSAGASSRNSVSNAVGANTSKDPSLLQKFRELAEGVTHTASSNHTAPSLFSKARRPQVEPAADADRSTWSNNRDFLNQALELAATESVEWRAFYVHQTISKTTGFLEDFLSPGQHTELLGSTHQVSTAPAQLQNTLFYKSICRTTLG